MPKLLTHSLGSALLQIIIKSQSLINSQYMKSTNFMRNLSLRRSNQSYSTKITEKSLSADNFHNGCVERIKNIDSDPELQAENVTFINKSQLNSDDLISYYSTPYIRNTQFKHIKSKRPTTPPPSPPQIIVQTIQIQRPPASTTPTFSTFRTRPTTPPPLPPILKQKEETPLYALITKTSKPKNSNNSSHYDSINEYNIAPQIPPRPILQASIDKPPIIPPKPSNYNTPSLLTCRVTLTLKKDLQHTESKNRIYSEMETMPIENFTPTLIQQVQLKKTGRDLTK